MERSERKLYNRTYPVPNPIDSIKLALGFGTGLIRTYNLLAPSVFVSYVLINRTKGLDKSRAFYFLEKGL